MTALTSELAGALDAVTAALGDTLRAVRFEHGKVVFEFGKVAVTVDPHTAVWDDEWSDTAWIGSAIDKGDRRAIRDVFRALAVEVEHWCGERLAQAVEDTDWTGGGTDGHIEAVEAILADVWSCRDCHGRGTVFGVGGELHRCRLCDGTGVAS